MLPLEISNRAYEFSRDQKKRVPECGWEERGGKKRTADRLLPDAHKFVLCGKSAGIFKKLYIFSAMNSAPTEGKKIEILIFTRENVTDSRITRRNGKTDHYSPEMDPRYLFFVRPERKLREKLHPFRVSIDEKQLRSERGDEKKVAGSRTTRSTPGQPAHKKQTSSASPHDDMTKDKQSTTPASTTTQEKVTASSVPRKGATKKPAAKKSPAKVCLFPPDTTHRSRGSPGDSGFRCRKKDSARVAEDRARASC